jgi:hypothetical protein
MHTFYAIFHVDWIIFGGGVANLQRDQVRCQKVVVRTVGGAVGHLSTSGGLHLFQLLHWASQGPAWEVLEADDDDEDEAEDGIEDDAEVYGDSDANAKDKDKRCRANS